MRLLKFITLFLCLLASSCSNEPHEQIHIHNFELKHNYNEHFYWCSICGEIFDKEEHTFSIFSYESSNCSHAGYIGYECDFCGYEKVESLSIDPNIHDLSNRYEYDQHQHWKECKDCHIRLEFENHSFVVEHFNPTYEESGYDLFKCSKCNYSYMDNFIGPLVHNFSTMWSFDETSHWHQCCDIGYEDLRTDIYSHNFYERCIKEPSFEEEGIMAYECECGFNYQTTLAKIPHNYSDSFSYNSDGHFHPCIDKGYEHLFIDYNSHTFTIKYVDNPNCTECGHAYYECGICGYVSEVFEIKPLGHDLEIAAYNDILHYQRCKRCNYIENKVEHDYECIDSGGSNGTYNFTCKDCGHSFVESKSIFSGCYIYKDGFAWINKRLKSTQATTIVIPNYIDSYPVQFADVTNKTDTDGENEFFYLNHQIKELYLSQFTTNLCSKFAAKLTNLEYVYIPNSVQSIDSLAFYNCNSLKSLKVSSNVKNFEFARGFPEITVTVLSLNDFMSSHKDVGTFFRLVDQENNLIENLEIYSDSVQICEKAFLNCHTIKRIKFNTNYDQFYLNLGDGAFSGCASLEDVDFSTTEKKVYIGKNVFSRCTSLKEITLPSNVVSIDTSAFFNCSSLETAKIYGLSSLKDGTFSNCVSLSAVYLPLTLIEILDEPFYNCDSLTDIYYEGTKDEWCLIYGYSKIKATVHFNSNY